MGGMVTSLGSIFVFFAEDDRWGDDFLESIEWIERERERGGGREGKRRDH